MPIFQNLNALGVRTKVNANEECSRRRASSITIEFTYVKIFRFSWGKLDSDYAPKLLFVCRFGKSKVPKCNICNSYYNRPTDNKSWLTKMFVQLFQPSVKEFVWFSSYPSPTSLNGSFSRFSSYSNFSTLLKNPVTNKRQLKRTSWL